MFDEFSRLALAAVLSAAEHARHELSCAALMREVVKHEGVAAAVRRLGVDPSRLTDADSATVDGGRFGFVRRRRARSRALPFSLPARAALDRAVDLRRHLDRPAVTLGLLMIALIEDDSPAGAALRARLPDPAEVRRELADVADPPEPARAVAAHRVRLTQRPSA
ncbi:MAG: hypothetical protein L0H64_08960 [Pseudonocardia sp.]|nr:hypothetical protein [Pseudonocardia sp.]